MDLITIIVPVYNVEKYINECVDSLISQTYKNLEIILIDDGSTDKSGEICDGYAASDARIKVIHKENEGLGFARNTGMTYASGSFIYFFDSDDYIEPTEIKRLYDFITKYNADAAFTGCTTITDKRKVLQRREYVEEYFSGNKMKDLATRMLGSSPEGHDCIEMSASGQLYRMQIIRGNSLQFESEQNLISEDLAFNLEFFKYANSACLVPGCGYFYRVNPESLSHSYRNDRFDASLKLYQYVCEQVQILELNEDALNRATKYLFVCVRSSIEQEAQKNPNRTMNDAIRRISEICSNNALICAIDKYPVRNLGLKQKLFLFFIKRKWCLALYFLSKKA